MTSLTLLTAQDFDDLTATNIYVDNIYSNEATNISIQSASNFLTLPSLQGTGIQQYIRESLTVTGALSYSTNQGVLHGITIDNYNRDVVLSLSGTTVLSADLTSGTGQSLVLYFNYSETVGSNKALGLEPTTASQTILGTIIPGNTTSLITTFEVLQSTLNQTFVPSGIFDLNVFTSTDNTNDGLELYAELIVWDGATETIIATTDSLVITEQYPAYGETTLSAINTTQRAFSVGYSFRIKLYGRNNRGSSHTLYTYYEGTGSAYSHVHTPFNVNLAGGYWDRMGNVVALTDIANTVSIGKTTSSGQSLEVSGNILTNNIYGLNASFGTGVYNYISGLYVSGTGIKCDTATFNAGNIVGLTASNLKASNLQVIGGSTFNGTIRVQADNPGLILSGTNLDTRVVIGQATVGNAWVNGTVSGDGVVYTDSTKALFLQNGSTTNTLVIRNNRIGVNKSAPDALLDVNGSASFNGAVDVAGLIRIKTSNPALIMSGPGSNLRVVVGQASGNNSYVDGTILGDAVFNSDATRAIFIQNGSAINALVISGNRLGLGTRTPNSLLDIAGTLNVAGLATFTNAGFTSMTGTNGRILNMSGTNIEYTTATFTNLTIGGSITANGNIYANNYKAKHWTGSTSTAGTPRYFKLATFGTTGDGSNAGGVRIHGQIGQWLAEYIGVVDFTISTRGPPSGIGGTLYSINATTLSNITNYIEFVLYIETNNTYTLYMAVKQQYTTYDLMVSCSTSGSATSPVLYEPTTTNVVPTGSVSVDSIITNRLTQYNMNGTLSMSGGINATFVNSFTFNGYNLSITGRDYGDTSGVVQGRFRAGYMPDGNYIGIGGTRASAFPGVDGSSTLSFYSKNAVPTSDAYFSTRLTSQGGSAGGISDGRFTIRSASLQFEDGNGVRQLTMSGNMVASFNTNLNISGTLSVSGVNGINIDGQYARLGLTLNASAPMVYSITLNRFSMPQVDDVGTDGYLSSAQYSAIVSASAYWGADTTNRLLYPTQNYYNIMSYNTDFNGSPAVRDNGIIWRRTLLSGSLDHSLRIRTGGTKDGYLIHQTQNSAPLQLCAGSLQPAVLLGGTFNDLIQANTTFHIKTFQNNIPTLMKLEMSGVSSASNYCEIELQDPSNDISLRTAGNSENLIIRDNTRATNRIQITPTTFSHAGTTATLASSGNNRIDIGNAGNTGQFIDFNVGVANDYDARMMCRLGATGTNGAGNIDFYHGRLQFVTPSGSAGGNYTQISSAGNFGINYAPASGVALTVSGNTRLIGGTVQFDNTDYTLSRNGQSMSLSVSGNNRIIITGNATNPSASPGYGSVSINSTFTWETMPQYTGGVILGHNSFTGAETLSLVNEYSLATTGGKSVGIGFNAVNSDSSVSRYGSIRVRPQGATIANNSSMSLAVVSSGTLVETLIVSGTNVEATSVLVPTIGTYRNKTGGVLAGDTSGKVSFYATSSTNARFEAGTLQADTNANATTTGADTTMSLSVNTGTGLASVFTARSNRTLIVAQGSANTSVFLGADTSTGGNGARWHYNGSDIYFDGKGTSAGPAFYFRSDTTAGATTRATISNTGRFTAGAELVATTVNAIGATIAYWSGANILGIFASDRRSKNSIEPIDDIELQELWSTMRPVKYFFNIQANNPINPDTGKKRKYYGFIANDLDSRIQLENRNVKIQMCRKCQMDCFHDVKCECEEYNELECECLPEWITNIRNYSERDMIAILTAKLKQQERTISNLQDELVKERIQYKTMEDRQNKRIATLDKQVGTLNYQIEKIIGALAFKGIPVKF